jgi:ABC-type polar amino acid transport system, ATPase component
MRVPSQTAETVIAIDVQDVWKRWGAFEALKGISFRVREGERVAVLGPSGSGKSTLLRCINHLETISAGRIYVRNQLVGYEERNGALHELDDRSLSEQRARIGMTFQNFNLFHHMTALENVMLALRLVKRLDRAAAEAVARGRLAWVGLEDKADAYPSQLSGGQQQRVAIARTTAMQPDVLLLDEPTSALDPALSREVVAAIHELAAAGQTMLIVTHEMSIARRFTDRVLFLADGVLLEDAPTDSFFEAPATERGALFLRHLQEGR